MNCRTMKSIYKIPKTPRYQRFVAELPTAFKLRTALVKGVELNLSRATVERHLTAAVRNGLLVRTSAGSYHKADPNRLHSFCFLVDIGKSNPCHRYVIAHSPRQAGMHFGLHNMKIGSHVVCLDYVPVQIDVNLTGCPLELVKFGYRARGLDTD